MAKPTGWDERLHGIMMSSPTYNAYWWDRNLEMCLKMQEALKVLMSEKCP